MYSNHTDSDVSNLRKTQGFSFGVGKQVYRSPQSLLFHVCCMEDGIMAFLKDQFKIQGNRMLERTVGPKDDKICTFNAERQIRDVILVLSDQHFLQKYQ